tara:strand:- start:329 stop:652 length:324 start_codon:yes stop_codon:yes gene_type:complete
MDKQEINALELINNDAGSQKRFELHVNGHIAFMDYIISKQGIIYLTHTEVPKSLEGQGVGSTLVSKVLEYVRTAGLKMAPLCPFLAAYLKRHPGKADGLLALGYSVG